MIARFRRWIGSLPARVNGSHVELECEQPTRLSTRAVFGPDDRLLLRMARAREQIGDVEVKSDRVVDELETRPIG